MKLSLQPIRLVLALLLPFIAIVVPSLCRQWDSRAAAAPMRVRRNLERILSDGRSVTPEISLQSYSGMGRDGRSTLWCGECRDYRGRAVRAIYDETADEVIRFSREPGGLSGDEGGDEDGDDAALDAESAKAAMRGFLRLLARQGIDSGRVTLELMEIKVSGGDYRSLWCIAGSRFYMQIERETGSVLFYTAKKGLVRG